MCYVIESTPLVRQPRQVFEKLASKFAELLGTSWALVLAFLIVSTWFAMTGLDDAFEHPRMFVVELTGMFIFLHLFLIQRTQNKDIKAIHLKLDELIATKDGASNTLIKAENASESVVDELQTAYVDLAKNVDHPTKSVSVGEAGKQAK